MALHNRRRLMMWGLRRQRDCGAIFGIVAQPFELQGGALPATRLLLCNHASPERAPRTRCPDRMTTYSAKQRYSSGIKQRHARLGPSWSFDGGQGGSDAAPSCRQRATRRGV